MQLEKPAQLAGAMMRNESSLFYTQALEEQLESDGFDRPVSTAEHQESGYQRRPKELGYQYIVKSIPNDDLDKSIAEYSAQETTWRL